MGDLMLHPFGGANRAAARELDPVEGKLTSSATAAPLPAGSHYR
jgi:hypothetical protein